jgi:hypothetical protein
MPLKIVHRPPIDPTRFAASWYFKFAASYDVFEQDQSFYIH